MPTLRQKVNQFCVVAGTTNASSMRIAKLEEALKKAKGDMKAHKQDMKYQQTQSRKAAKAKTQRAPKVRKAAKAPKAPKMKQEVQMMPLPAQAEPMMPAPAPSLAPAAAPPGPPKAGTRRRRRSMRW